MGIVFSFDWEIRLLEWLQSLQTPFTDALAIFFTLFGEEFFIVLVLGLAYWCFSKSLGRRLAVTIFGAALFGSMLKSVVTRRRPYMDNPTVKCIRASDPGEDIMQVSAQGYSFPSLHAVMSAAMCSTFAAWFKKNWVTLICVIMPLFIGLSRNYLGVHYPTDVLVGWAIGIGLTFLLSFAEKLYGYKVSFALLSIFGAIGAIFCRDNEYFTLYGIVIGMPFGFAFEEKYVHFDTAHHLLSYIIRPLLGAAVFLSCSSLLKAVFKLVPLPEDHIITLLLRSLRYAITAFITIGVFPFTFAIGKGKVKVRE